MKTNEKPNRCKKIFILGSGGLRIGQAGEFDYSGSQAIKAIKEEKIRTVLINPNIATVQTDAAMADEVYLQSLNVEIVTKIIEKERPDGILLGFGGQTALNLGLKLEEAGIFKKYNVAVLGTPVSAIRLTEDRDLFKKNLASIGIKSPEKHRRLHSQRSSCRCEKDRLSRHDALRFFSGRPRIGKNRKRRRAATARAAKRLSGAPQILIEEYLLGWKELEYEIVRDAFDNAVTVCNMENFDPMGIHTGESIVVAPSQTLTNRRIPLLTRDRHPRGPPFRDRRRMQHPIRLKSEKRRLPRH